MDGGVSNKKFWEIIIGIFLLIFCLVIILASILKVEESTQILRQEEIVKDTIEVEEEYENEIEEQLNHAVLQNNCEDSDSVVEFDNFTVEFKNLH